MMKAWLNTLYGAIHDKLHAPPKTSLPGMAGWAIVSGKMQGYLTGQKVPSKRPVYRAKWIGDRSKYKPHQGKAECERRVRQGLAG